MILINVSELSVKVFLMKKLSEIVMIFNNTVADMFSISISIFILSFVLFFQCLWFKLKKKKKTFL